MLYKKIYSPENGLASELQSGVSDGIYTTASNDQVLTFEVALEKIVLIASGSALKLDINQSGVVINVATTDPVVIDNMIITSVTVKGNSGQTIGFIGYGHGLNR